jgi:hypothetical protein
MLCVDLPFFKYYAMVRFPMTVISYSGKTANCKQKGLLKQNLTPIKGYFFRKKSIILLYKLKEVI